jgi:hypothetical protein
MISQTAAAARPGARAASLAAPRVEPAEFVATLAVPQPSQPSAAPTGARAASIAARPRQPAA